MKTTDSKTSSPTQKAIAEALKITTRRVRQLKADGMPTESIEAAMTWRDAKAEAALPHEQLVKERVRLTRAQADKHQFLLEVEKGLYLKRDDVHSNIAAISQALAAFISRLIQDLPPLVEGLPRQKSAPLIKLHVRRLQAMLSDLTSDFWQKYPAENADI
jgi:phage terminase Nu1 subunit (DNA packaging protein)